MLDTIAINLQQSDYIIHCPDRFQPHAGIITNSVYRGKGIVKCAYNPDENEKALGYMPRATLYRKPYGPNAEAIWLKIEFSAPKLIFGNNFEELRGKDDFNNVVTALQEALNRMGIEISYDALIKAKISAIHYSKNILLKRDLPCNRLIQFLERADMTTRLDLSQTDFRNAGQMVKYHANDYEIAFYDKMRDLEQVRKYGARRGVETDYSSRFELMGTRHSEVLRLEVRLKSRKLKPLLSALGIKPKTTLEELFCTDISRTVLLHYWGEITKGLYILNINTTGSENLTYNIRTHFPNKRLNGVLGPRPN